MTEASVVADPVTDAANRLKTLAKVITTKAAIAQTPKELVWTLNKAKLYHYIPVLPKEKRHPVPLLLVFALAGLGFSLYLAHIEANILGVWCIYCVASLGVISLLTLLTFGTILGSRRRGGRAAASNP